MDSSQAEAQVLGERRTYQMRMDQINTKLSSKRDWYEYLEKHLVSSTWDLRYRKVSAGLN